MLPCFPDLFQHEIFLVRMILERINRDNRGISVYYTEFSRLTIYLQG